MGPLKFRSSCRNLRAATKSLPPTAHEIDEPPRLQMPSELSFRGICEALTFSTLLRSNNINTIVLFLRFTRIHQQHSSIRLYSFTVAVGPAGVGSMGSAGLDFVRRCTIQIATRALSYDLQCTILRCARTLLHCAIAYTPKASAGGPMG